MKKKNAPAGCKCCGCKTYVTEFNKDILHPTIYTQFKRVFVHEKVTQRPALRTKVYVNGVLTYQGDHVTGSPSGEVTISESTSSPVDSINESDVFGISEDVEVVDHYEITGTDEHETYDNGNGTVYTQIDAIYHATTTTETTTRWVTAEFDLSDSVLSFVGPALRQIQLGPHSSKVLLRSAAIPGLSNLGHYTRSTNQLHIGVTLDTVSDVASFWASQSPWASQPFGMEIIDTVDQTTLLANPTGFSIYGANINEVYGTAAASVFAVTAQLNLNLSISDAENTEDWRTRFDRTADGAIVTSLKPLPKQDFRILVSSLMPDVADDTLQTQTDRPRSWLYDDTNRLTLELFTKDDDDEINFITQTFAMKRFLTSYESPGDFDAEAEGFIYENSLTQAERNEGVQVEFHAIESTGDLGDHVHALYSVFKDAVGYYIRSGTTGREYVLDGYLADAHLTDDWFFKFRENYIEFPKFTNRKGAYREKQNDGIDRRTYYADHTNPGTIELPEPRPSGLFLRLIYTDAFPGSLTATKIEIEEIAPPDRTGRNCAIRETCQHMPLRNLTNAEMTAIDLGAITGPGNPESLRKYACNTTQLRVPSSLVTPTVTMHDSHLLVTQTSTYQASSVYGSCIPNGTQEQHVYQRGYERKVTAAWAQYPTAKVDSFISVSAAGQDGFVALDCLVNITTRAMRPPGGLFRRLRQGLGRGWRYT